MTELKILKVDEKWSIAYDASINDTPRYWLRYGERTGSPGSTWDENNAVTAMFYELLAARNTNSPSDGSQL